MPNGTRAQNWAITAAKATGFWGHTSSGGSPPTLRMIHLISVSLIIVTRPGNSTMTVNAPHPHVCQQQ